MWALVWGVGACLAAPGAGAQSSARKPGALRATALVWPEDAFSERIAEVIDQLGYARLAREPSLEALPSESLVAADSDKAELATYGRAIEQAHLGSAAYENLEPVKAVEHLRSAVDLFEQVPGLLVDEHRQPYLEALTYLGASLILRGDPQEGQAAFRQLLVLERRTKLDKRLFPPGMVRMFDSAREDLRTGPVGSLAIFSSPAHARIYVDGFFRGVTPRTVDRLPTGRHLVHVRKAGYQSWGRAVKVEGAEEKRVHCRLPDLPGGEELNQALSEATASFDDPLAPRFQALALSVGLERLALGRLSQRDRLVGLQLAWYDVTSGKRLRSHAVVLDPEAAEFAKAVDSVFSFLLSGRADVLQSSAVATDAAGPLRFKDEPLFVEVDVPVYERWYFWTAIGVGVAAAVGLTLGLVLTGEDQPASKILLEF